MNSHRKPVLLNNAHIINTLMKKFFAAVCFLSLSDDIIRQGGLNSLYT